MPNETLSLRKNILIGFALSGVLLLMALWFNIAGLMTLIAQTTMGWLVALLMWVVNGVVFSAVQVLLSGDDDEDDDHHGGRRMRDMERDHAVVRVPVEKQRGPF
ncbi:MAG: hypothetical protein AAFY35_13175 [Pseudomonadota bacterium]